MGSSRNISDEVNKQSSEELSSLAAKVLNLDPAEAGFVELDQLVEQYNNLLTDAKRLAGSVLSQDETPQEIRHKCPTCSSVGFAISKLDPRKCEFCDGTFGGNPE